MNVELIYDNDCPNVGATRSLLIKAFTETGVSARWKEWERSAPDGPAYVQGFGSPTILVDGHDIGGVAAGSAVRACRVYTGVGGIIQSLPPLESICTALRKAAPYKFGRTMRSGRGQAVLASFSAVGAALLPKLTCPLCFPAYAALLSTVGLEFFDYTPYLLPFTIAFLLVANGVLLMQGRRNGFWIPLLIGLIASLVVVLGKFAFELEWLSNTGIGLLVVAIFIGSRRQKTQAAACSGCVEDAKPLLN
jgi:mercuric ion transport protein